MMLSSLKGAIAKVNGGCGEDRHNNTYLDIMTLTLT